MNRALRALLTPLLPADCEVRFGPASSGAASSGAASSGAASSGAAGADGGSGRPALVWFLADVREDEKAAGTEWEDIRDDTGRVVARRPPVRRFDLFYAVTAETADPDTEASLLDAVLVAADPGKRLPAALLDASLAGRPVMLRLGDRAHPDLSPGRTTLTVVANAPLVLPPVADVAAPAEEIRLDVAAPGRPVPPPPIPRRPGPGRWRGAAVEEESDAVRGEDE